MKNVVIRQTGFHSEGYAERRISVMLWGYPDLFKKFQEGLLPALAEARKERRQGHSPEPIVPEVAVESRDSITILPPLPGHTAVFADGPGPSNATQADVNLDNHAQRDEHTLFTAGGGTDPQESMPGDPSLLTDGPVIGVGATLLNVIEEVISTLENETRSRS